MSSCHETPACGACVAVASAQSTLDESQVFSVLHSGIAEARQYGLLASEEEYHQRLSGLQRRLSDDPTGLGGRSRRLGERLAAVLVPSEPNAGCRYALVSLQDRVTMAERHLSRLVGRLSVTLREPPEVTRRRYDAYRAEAELNHNCRAPGEFTRRLVLARSTWAAPRDRVTAWALYRLAQDAGVEPRAKADCTQA